METKKNLAKLGSECRSHLILHVYPTNFHVSPAVECAGWKRIRHVRMENLVEVQFISRDGYWKYLSVRHVVQHEKDEHVQ